MNSKFIVVFGQEQPQMRANTTIRVTQGFTAVAVNYKSHSVVSMHS